MRIFFLTVFLTFLSSTCFSKQVTLETFKWSESFECGEKKYSKFNIHISIDEYDNVVVDYERKHFTNLEKIKIPLTYYIRGGETSLKIRKNDNVYVLDMILKEYEPDFKDDLFIITLIFDKTNLTYQTRKSRQNSKTNELVVYNTSTSMKSGFCFRDTSSHIDN